MGGFGSAPKEDDKYDMGEFPVVFKTNARVDIWSRISVVILGEMGTKTYSLIAYGPESYINISYAE
jgi:hypothetical protein